MEPAPARSSALAIAALLASHLAAPFALPGADASAAEAHPGVSDLDVALLLDRLAAEPGAALAALAPLTGTGKPLAAPAELGARLRTPAPLGDVLAELAAAQGLPSDLDPLPALPPDLARALATLGEGVLGARGLALRGEALAGAALLQEAVEEAKPVLQRQAVLLRHDALSGLARDAPGTQSLVDRLAGARDASSALAAAGVAPAPAMDPAGVPPLSELLGQLYADLGLPLALPGRAALAAADGLAPGLRDPLRAALAHTLSAARLRERAVAGLTGADLTVLGAVDEVLAAASVAEPSAAQVALLAAYGEAAARLDTAAMRDAAGHLAAAAAALLDVAPPARAGFEVRTPPFLAQSTQTASSPASRQVSVGSLVLEFGGRGGAADVALRLGAGQAPALQAAGVRASADAATGVVTLFEDRNGDLAAQGDEVVFASAPLARPDRDVLFTDPYGLVVVSGAGVTATTADLGGRDVRVALDPAAPPSPRPPDAPGLALQRFDAALRGLPTLGAWPFARAELAGLWAFAAEGSRHAPREAVVTVNPAGYQLVRWDLGGDDAYLTNAAGAGQRGLLAVRGDGALAALRHEASARPLPAALLVDAGGNDTYRTAERDTLAAANASVALLWDAAGDDRFEAGADEALAHAAAGGVAVLVSGPGNATFAGRGRSLGHASGGASALLLDLGGRDAYRGGNASVAASEAGALAALLDLGGDDAYRAGPRGLAASAGGVALLADHAGDDAYAPDARDQALGHARPAANTPGIARIALLLDLAGSDEGACSGGSLRGPLGRASLERDPVPRPEPAGPYEPAWGACLDVDARYPAPAPDVPPTFYTSAWGSFTLPGLARLGTPGDDLVPDPYVLSVDLAGNDTYGAGAVAVVEPARAAGAAARRSLDLGWVAPAALALDANGRDVHDADLAAWLPGHFGYADAGVAVQVAWQTDLLGLALDPGAAGNATGAAWLVAYAALTERNATYAMENATVAPARAAPSAGAAGLRAKAGEDAFVHVAHGLASARNGGAALLLAQGTDLVVGPAPDATAGASCRMACARSGGAAVALALGGRHDLEATPSSLGAVVEGPAGGVALWHHRGGPDRFGGSPLSMGVVRPPPRGAEPPDPLVDAAGPALAARPSVALFVKDGGSLDLYEANLTRPGAGIPPRGDNRLWEDRRPEDGLPLQGPRRLVVAQGVDNLDWYAHSRVAAADGGLAPGVGPAPFAVLGRTFYGPAYSGALAAQGNSTTGPYGVRPVTLARTALSPTINVTGIRLDQDKDPRAPTDVSTLSGTVRVDALIKNPLAMQDANLLHAVNDTGYAQSSANRDGTAIHRVELVVEGKGGLWRGCPAPERADRLWPGACVVASWDRDVDPFMGNGEVTRDPDRLDQETRLDQFRLQWNASDTRRDGAFGYVFPPGPYVITVRAYAARPHGLPLRPYGVHDPVLDGIWAEGANVTDDRYGLHGAWFHIELPLFNAPLFAPVERFVDKNLEHDAQVLVNVSEPGTFRAVVTDNALTNFGSSKKMEDGIPCRVGLQLDPKVRIVDCLGNRTTPLFGDREGYLAAGQDVLDLRWPAAGKPEGKYVLHVYHTGEYSGRTTLKRDLPVAVDFAAFDSTIDPFGMPRVIRRADTPAGAEPGRRGPFNLTMVTDPGPAIARGWHLWVQRDVLDAAEPTRILETQEWTYSGLWGTGVGERRAFQVRDRLVPELNITRNFTVVAFQGEPFPGPPLRYRLAAYHEDRAGNINVTEPTTTRPAAPDCATHVLPQADGEDPGMAVRRTRCAEFVYDITPPATRLRLVDPVPEVARTRGGDIVFAMDAEQTPDIANVTLLVHAGNATAEPALDEYEVALARDLAGPADRELRWRPNATQLQHGTVLRFLLLGADWVGNVEEKATYDERVEVDLEPPRVLGPPEVEARSGEATIAWETDEPARGAVRVVPQESTEAIVVREPGEGLEGLRTRHEVRLTGLRPGTEHAFTLVSEDAVGNVANVSAVEERLLTFRTEAAVEVELDAVPGLVARPTEVRWTARNVEEPHVRFRVLLSLDGGRTYPREVARFEALAEEGERWNLTLDPAALPEAPQARLRVLAHPAADPAAVASATSAPFLLDGHAPRSRLDAPAGLADFTNTPVEARVTATDGGAGVAGVEWSEDNVTFRPVTGPLRFAGASEQVVFVRARDRAGHVEVPSPVRVRLDGISPTLGLEGPAGPVRAAEVGVRVRAADAASGLDRVVAVDASGARHELPADAFGDGAAWLLWRVPGEEGAQRLDVTAWDRAGNAARASLEVTVDRRPPAGVARVVDVGPSRAALTLRADEPVRVRATLAGGLPGAAAAAPDAEVMAARLSLTGLRPGTAHTLHVVLEDRAGNLATLNVPFATPPDLVPPGAPGFLDAELLPDGSVRLSWGAAADDAGVDRYEVHRDAAAGAAGSDARPVATPSRTSFLDASAEPGRTYRYRVLALDVGGNRGPAVAGTLVPRTAPRVIDVTAGPGEAPGTLRVTVDVRDDDGDAPRGALLLGGRTHDLGRALALPDGGWRLAATVPAPAAGLDEASRAFHVVVRDGLFEARDPPAGSHHAPAVPPAPAPQGSLLGLAVLLAVPAAGAWRRRRGKA